MIVHLLFKEKKTLKRWLMYPLKLIQKMEQGYTVNSHHYLYPHLNSTPDHPPPQKKNSV